jgi:hypothetical protein
LQYEYFKPGSDGAKSQARAKQIVLENKDAARASMVDALLSNTFGLREGAADIAGEWADPEFIDPLFKAFGATRVNTRQNVGYALAKQAEVMDQDARDKAALRLMELVEKESDVYVLTACAKAFTAFACKATNAPLKAYKDSIFVTKKRKLSAMDGSASSFFILLLSSSLDSAIAATK